MHLEDSGCSPCSAHPCSRCSCISIPVEPVYLAGSVRGYRPTQKRCLMHDLLPLYQVLGHPSRCDLIGVKIFSQIIHHQAHLHSSRATLR